MSAGVVGNAAYDALKAALSRLSRWKKNPPDALESEADASLVAREALRRRAVAVGIHDLSDDVALHVDCRPVQDGWRVSFDGDGIEALVWISPARVSEEGAMVKVRIARRRSSRDSQERAVNAWFDEGDDPWRPDEPGVPGVIR